MGKKSKRFFLPANDCDVSLVKAQMAVYFVGGFGFTGFRKGIIIDPMEIVEKSKKASHSKNSLDKQ